MIPLSRLKPPRDLCDPRAAPVSEPAIMLPLVVCRKDAAGNRYTIIDGVKRYRLLKRRRRRTAACAILDGTMDERSLVLMRARLNRSRQLSLREKLLLLRWLKGHAKDGRAVETAREMGFDDQEIVLLTPLVSARSAVVEAVCAGTLHLGIVKTFMLLSHADQEAFLRAFRGADLSFQTQREFLEWLTEAAFTEKASVRAILQAPSVRAHLGNRTLNWPQRIQKTRSALHAQRFPRLSAAQERWRKLAASVNPDPSKVQFVPSPFFEKNKLEVRIALTKAGTAPGLLRRLAGIPETAWQALIYPQEGGEG